MGVLSLLSPETSTSQQVINQQATSQSGGVIGSNAARGPGGTVGYGGFTFGQGIGANLRNVGNSNTRIYNQVAGLTSTLQRQQNNLNRAKPGTARYNQIADNIARTQGKLNILKQTISAANPTINAGTTINVTNTSTDLNALALAGDALHAITDVTHDVLNANQNLAGASLANTTGIAGAAGAGAQDLASQALQQAGQANPTIAENKLPLYLIIGAVAITAIILINK